LKRDALSLLCLTLLGKLSSAGFNGRPKLHQ
jgi:hypothetical protein